ncbi:MAG: hypothetical protein WKF87_20870 [Chryseolinea sp.]
MRIATYNVNGVNGGLPVLLRWFDDSHSRYIEALIDGRRGPANRPFFAQPVIEK